MLMTFGEAMLELIKQRGLSATAVAEELGYKNRTAFFRILHDESKLTGIMKCFEAAKKSEMLALNPSETDALFRAVRVSESGKQAYGMNAALHGIFYPERRKEAATDIAIEGIGGADTLEEVLGMLPEDGSAQAALLGRCPMDVLDRLCRAAREQRIWRIVHLIAIDENAPEDVSLLSASIDALFFDGYEAFYLDETGMNEKNWWLRSAIILLIVEDEAGKQKAIQLGLAGENRYVGLFDETGASIGFFRGMHDSVRERMIPIKREDHPAGCGEERQDKRTASGAKRERCRALYLMASDVTAVCAEHIGECLYEKKKPVYLILSLPAMMRFARTGWGSDVFFMEQPCTVEGRVEMLTSLRRLTANHPRFFVRLQEDDAFMDGREMILYDGYGVSLVQARERRSGVMREVMLEGRTLAKHMKSYIESEIFGEGAVTREKTAELLDGMIEEAKRSRENCPQRAANCG